MRVGPKHAVAPQPTRGDEAKPPTPGPAGLPVVGPVAHGRRRGCELPGWAGCAWRGAECVWVPLQSQDGGVSLPSAEGMRVCVSAGEVWGVRSVIRSQTLGRLCRGSPGKWLRAAQQLVCARRFALCRPSLGVASIRERLRPRDHALHFRRGMQWNQLHVRML
jgi:hypothetical protein